MTEQESQELREAFEEQFAEGWGPTREDAFRWAAWGASHERKRMEGRVEELRKALEPARQILEACAEPQPYYGHYMQGMDPREYMPDPETNTPIEIDNLYRACEEWDAGATETSRERRAMGYISSRGAPGYVGDPIATEALAEFSRALSLLQSDVKEGGQ